MQVFFARCGASIKDYIIKMARGEHSLSRAFWVNYVLACVILSVVLFIVLLGITVISFPKEAIMGGVLNAHTDPFAIFLLLKTKTWTYIASIFAQMMPTIYIFFSLFAWFKSAKNYEGSNFWVYLSFVMLVFETLHIVHGSYYMIKFVF